MGDPVPAEERGIWTARARSFGAVAADYAALRPGYPADAVAFLTGERPVRVLDLGAGTGLLTAVLVAAGHDVVAVDPSAEMLAQLSARLPGVATGVGSAEQLPLPDGDVDVVVAGQAAHWFDPGPAARELRRVLRPGGTVGFVWNTRDERVPWVHALAELLVPEDRGTAADRAVVEAFARELPADVARHDSAIAQRSTPEQVVASFGTRSYVALMDDDDRARFLARLRDLLAEHPGSRGRAELDMPYLTAAFRLTPR